MSTKFTYAQIRGIKGNPLVTSEFIKGVEKMAERLETKPEYIFAAMSFETGGTFDPAKQNSIGATGLIQFIKLTAENLGTTVDELAKMSAGKQLEFVEKYLKPFKGKLETLEAVYTSILAGSPKKPDDVLFRAGTLAYKLNPLDWNKDGKITAREATNIVAALMFGGIVKIQQKLLELGFVSENLRDGFTDGRWGENTSKALAKFQKSKKLSETGLMDEATGSALFSGAAEETTVKILKRGASGEAVKKFQDAIIKLGYLSAEKSSDGKFGAQTESAIKQMQTHLGFPATGEFGDAEQSAVKIILSGISRRNSAVQVVKAIQNRLAALDYVTQTQVNSGYGIFGLQTEAAVKKFQKENLLQQSGVVEEVTFRMLFNQIAPDKTTEKDVFAAIDGKYYNVAKDILMTKKLEKKLVEVAKIYFEEKKTKLYITSGYRPPERQSQVIYNNIAGKGEPRVRATYNDKLAIEQILAAYHANKNNSQKAIDAMTEIIAKQVKRGVFISKHLLSNAIDIKATANFKSLGRAAAQVGGRIITEGDHFHMELA